MSDETRMFPDRRQLCRRAATELVGILAAAVRQRGEASAVLTGGGTGTGILSALAELVEADGTGAGAVPMPDWSRVHLWWGDERFLPTGDPDRNEVQAHEALLDLLKSTHGMPAENIHPMPAAGTLGLDEAADAYAAELLSRAQIQQTQDQQTQTSAGVDPRLPVFDVVMLGVGPDAHVASLFPGLPGPLATEATVIAVTDSPKPPPLRLSLTVEALNTAEHLWFVVAGADKSEAVSAVRTARDSKTTEAARWPASVVFGRSSTTWWLDEAAAGH
ncbi:6-phosphogluconolactonase [Microbacterium sp. A93]|uniref:6-phosphogluconolactonase n=1 Tax=Microbacterium sp. A93 TaxID=3450716 RepID=UPI003F42EB5D